MEGLADLPAILKRIEQLSGAIFSEGRQSPCRASVGKQGQDDGRDYDVDGLYARFQGQDPEPCRRYLVDRGIDPELVEELINEGEVVHNHYHGISYCCFAVRDREGTLKCLDNHEIGGRRKFVLGQKSIFTRDWVSLQGGPAVFIAEGVIDYLSIKTLEKNALAGLALLGNQLLFEADLLAGCHHIISALDEDRGGSSALFDLMEQYPDKEITTYDLQGHKDPNELLQALHKEPRRLTAADKLTLYEQFQQAENKSELARQWGIDRSHMYQIVRDCKQLLLSSLSDRGPGRRPADQPETVKDAWQQIQQLQEENKRLAIERDTLHCREELLGIRLKWAEIEAAEARNEPVDEHTGPKRKVQIKKKKKKKRLRR
jgi:transposase-like protein